MNRLKRSLVAIIFAGTFGFCGDAIASGPRCLFTPAGLYCGPDFSLTCPICPPPSYPRLNLDQQQLALKEAALELKKTVNVAQETYNNLNQTTKDLWGQKGEDGHFDSDDMLRGITFPKMDPASNPDPAVNANAEMGVMVDQILASQFINQSNPTVEDQLAMRVKRIEIYNKQLMLANGAAMNNRMIYQSTESNQALNDRLQEKLTQQVSDVLSDDPDVMRLVAVRGATMRAILAQQSRQNGLIATFLTTKALKRYATGDVPITRPTLYNAADPQNASSDNSRPEVRALLNMRDTISSAQLGASTQTQGINLGGIGVTPEQRELQILNFNQNGQRQRSEPFVNSVETRAKLIERLHNHRVLIYMNQLSIQHMDDNISCHNFSMQQLDDVRRQIVPYLRLVTSPGGGFPWGGGTPATTMGPFRHTTTPYTHPDYPAQKTNLDLAFEAIAGRPARYRYNTETLRADIVVPEYRGKLMRLDNTTYYDNTRHSRETSAGCQVAATLMRGRTQINQIESDLPPAARILTPQFHQTVNTCTPRQIRINETTNDMTYCLRDDVRQTLAPVVVNRADSESWADAVRDIEPGDACLFTITGRQWAFSSGPRAVSSKNYHRATNVGPPVGLFGKWLQAYKIERYWAANRFGYEYQQDGQANQYIGSEGFRHKTILQMQDIVAQHRETMKALNDADDRAEGGIGDTPLPNIDITTPDGRYQSMQYQLTQTQKLEADVREKQVRIADYERRKAELQPPAEAPAEIRRQWDVYVHNMEQVKAEILRDIETINSFRAFAMDIVDDRQASALPDFDFHSNRCFIYRKPRAVNVNIEDTGTQTLIDEASGTSYQAPIRTDRIEVQQRQCVTLKPVEVQCGNISRPDDRIYVTPRQLDE